MKTSKLPCFFLISSLSVLAACELDASEDGQEMPPEVAEAIDNLQWATVDLGDGPQEIAYEEIDGYAVMEGDMILGPVAQVASGNFRLAPLSEMPEPGASGDLIASVRAFNAWPGGVIPWRMAPSLSGTTAGNRLISAMSTWEATGAVRFVARTDEPTYLFLTNASSDMAAGEGRSTVGYVPGATLRVGASVSSRTARHELGHAIGLKHEHTRLDRDSHVKIFWSNVRSDRVGNYLTHGPESADYDSYDRSSIMHYRSTTFAVNTSFPAMLRNRSECFFAPMSTQPSTCTLSPSSTPTNGDTRGLLSLYGHEMKLRNASNNRCLRPSGGSTASGTAVITSSCSNTNSRRWYRVHNAENTGDLIVNKHSLLCLTRPSSGNGMIQTPCTGAQNQQFQSIGNGGGIQLRAVGVGSRCVRRISSQSQTILSTSCSSTSSRRWYIDAP